MILISQVHETDYIEVQAALSQFNIFKYTTFSRLFEYLDMMFLLNSRKDDVGKEVAESNIRFGERRASLKLDSHTAVAGECKRQFPCV